MACFQYHIKPLSYDPQLSEFVYCSLFKNPGIYT